MYYHKPAESSVPRLGPAPDKPQQPAASPFVPQPAASPFAPSDGPKERSQPLGRPREGAPPPTPVPWTTPVTAQPPASPFSAQKTEPPLGDKRSFEEKERDDRAKLVYSPRPEDVFALANDGTLERRIIERLREEERKAGRDPFAKYPKGITFPPATPAGAGLSYVAKTADYPPRQVEYVSGYVVHRRLHFEEKNAERYGWDLGILQPLVSAAYFYKDVLLWPNSLASGVAYGFWDTNMGKCLPGSPTPYYLYPPGLTITGSAVEGLVITGAAFAIP
jgi:hypothetical protein